MESDSEYKKRFQAALIEMKTLKLKKQICRPPLYRLFWLLGLKVRPPLYIPAAKLFVVYSIAIALLWAIFLWVLHWRHAALSLEDLTVTHVVFYSIIVGGLVGAIISWQNNHHRQKYKLSDWEDLKLHHENE